MWETEPAPAGFNLDRLAQRGRDEANDLAIEIPVGHGPDRHPLARQGDSRASRRSRPRTASASSRGIEAVKRPRAAAQATPATAGRTARFEAHKADLGFGLLLKKYVDDLRQATPGDHRAGRSHDTVPRVAPMFWSFRVMVGLGFADAARCSAWPSGTPCKAALPTSPGCCGLRAVVAADALDRLRGGLVRRRIRPPALDHLRRAAHPPVGLDPQRRAACTGRWPALSASTPCC